MINVNTFIHSLDNSNNLVITPHVMNDAGLKKTTYITAEQLIHRMSVNCENVVFNNALGVYVDPILSAALSQYSLISAQNFINENYDKKIYTDFISTFGLPLLILLHNNIEHYVDKFLQFYSDKNVYVLDKDKFCPLFLDFLLCLQRYTTVQWIDTSAVRPINKKNKMGIATILAPVFVCDAIELQCLKTSLDVSRNTVQRLSYSSAYQAINLFFDFFHNPSVHTVIPFLKMVLTEEQITKKKTFIPLCNDVYQSYINPLNESDFLLPDELSFLKHVSLIDRGNVSAVISYLIYFSPLFEKFPLPRKRVLEDYLLNESEFKFDDLFATFKSIELISEIDTDWQFRHHVFIAKDRSLSSYPVIAKKLTEIDLQDI